MRQDVDNSMKVPVLEDRTATLCMYVSHPESCVDIYRRFELYYVLFYYCMYMITQLSDDVVSYMSSEVGV